MGRTRKVQQEVVVTSIYEKVSNKIVEIEVTKEKLSQLKEELKLLNEEKDKYEMNKLFEQMKANNISLDYALKIMEANKPEPNPEPEPDHIEPPKEPKESAKNKNKNNIDNVDNK